MAKFERFERVRRRENGYYRQYYFRLKAGNGEIIAQSEAYATKQARDKGIRAVRRAALLARVVDEVLDIATMEDV